MRVFGFLSSKSNPLPFPHSTFPYLGIYLISYIHTSESANPTETSAGGMNSKEALASQSLIV